MKKRKNKRKVSKITLILIAFVWMIAIVFTLMFMLNTIKKSNKLKSISSSVPIPDGFYYVGGEVDTGVVISDNKEDEFKGTDYNSLEKMQGNQFVWIPVEKAVVDNYDEASKLINEGKNPIAWRYGGNYYGLVYSFDITFHSFRVAEENFNINYITEPYILKSNIYGDNEQYIEGSTQDLYQTTFNKMVEQVEKNKGFYISRFEIGNLKNAVNNNEKVVSKANQEDITNQSWIDLYKALGSMYGRDDITTEMIWGCQWDATLAWIASNSNLNRYVYNSREIGNYYNVIQKTGSNSKYCLNNIYDLAGNAYEWTQRGTLRGGRIAAGGSHLSDDSLNYSLNDKRQYGITYLWKEVGTRMTMYVN